MAAGSLSLVVDLQLSDEDNRRLDAVSALLEPLSEEVRERFFASLGGTGFAWRLHQEPAGGATDATLARFSIHFDFDELVAAARRAARGDGADLHGAPHG